MTNRMSKSELLIEVKSRVGWGLFFWAGIIARRLVTPEAPTDYQWVTAEGLKTSASTLIHSGAVLTGGRQAILFTFGYNSILV